MTCKQSQQLKALKQQRKSGYFCRGKLVFIEKNTDRQMEHDGASNAEQQQLQTGSLKVVTWNIEGLQSKTDQTHIRHHKGYWHMDFF